MAEFAHLLESPPIYHLFESEFNNMLDNEKDAADLDPEMKPLLPKNLVSD